MATFRKTKYLTCFYCGRRTSTRYDGRIRQFECPNCDATNYLDEHGDITDPPVATNKIESLSFQYASPRSASPLPTSSSQIFCETCIKNQHLFTTSLAQYLPDDPHHPEYAERERNYYKFRRGLEQRYPQVCANCEPKVLGQIQKAGYTAKTDHLRRMIDRSRQVRNTAEGSFLNVVDTAGKATWIVGLILQLLWHASVVHEILELRHVFEYKDAWAISIIRDSNVLFALLPRADRLIHWSIWASLLSLWWNPRLVQTVRGFTKHLIGLSNWYTYQAMVLVIKVGVFRVSTLPEAQEAKPMRQIGAHLSMAMFMLFIYNFARRSIRIDTTPLFGVGPSQRTLQAPLVLPGSHVTNKQSMSDILDEILHEPAPKSGAAPSGISASNNYPRADQQRTLRSAYNPSTAAISGNPFQRSNGQSRKSSLSIDSLSLSENSGSGPGQVVQYEEQMDWLPTQSKHRAFNTQGNGQQQNGSFGQTPANPKAGQFWFKVPPAPSTPAQRLFNPPNAPRIRTSPVVKEPLHFQGNGARSPQGQARPGPSDPGAETIFANPSFFAQSQRDERDSLSDLFGKSFSLNGGSGQQNGQMSRRTPGKEPRHKISHRSHWQIVQLTVLIACLALWLHASATQHEYSTQVTIGILLVCGTISARINGSTLKGVAEEKELNWIAAIGTVLGIGEIFFACQVALRMWGSSEACVACADQGGWLIGTMIAHQIWNLLV